MTRHHKDVQVVISTDSENGRVLWVFGLVLLLLWTAGTVIGCDQDRQPQAASVKPNTHERTSTAKSSPQPGSASAPRAQTGAKSSQDGDEDAEAPYKPSEASDGKCACPKGMALIPAGDFVMGSPPDEPGRDEYTIEDEIRTIMETTWEAQHKVILTRPFCMGRTEVTRRSWTKVMGAPPLDFDSEGRPPFKLTKEEKANPEVPMRGVNFWTALKFANELSRMHDLPECFEQKECQRSPQFSSEFACGSAEVTTGDIYSCKGFRIPTDAEWEYAYRAGTKTMYHNGDCSEVGKENAACEKLLDEIAWYEANAQDSPRAVEKKKPNVFGLFDMSGNLREWVWDQHLPIANPEQVVVDPVVPESNRGRAEGGFRVTRGGSFESSLKELRAAQRIESGTDGMDLEELGVRVVKTADCD